jgi:hypothetical protein
MNIALLGAGGEMRGRLTANLRPHSEYEIDHVEIDEAGRKRLAEQGIQPVDVTEAIKRAEVVIALPPKKRTCNSRFLWCIIEAIG